MTTSNTTFLPGEPIAPSEPLGRYLPRLPLGATAQWLTENIPSHSWVLDPFGASPHLALEAAQAGYRVLVITSNPIIRFLLESKATPPQPEDMQSALAALSALRRGDERLEVHIRNLYLTRCVECEALIDAQAFLWERSGNAPYARIYTCPHCQHSGEFPTTAEDVQRLNQISPPGLYRARALERVAATDDPNRLHAEEALDVYLPRAVYAIINIVNKLDSLSPDLNQAKHIHALLLAAFDQGNNLWRTPTEPFRPRQLSTPPRFVEKNIWLALEDAAHILTDGNPPATPLTFWPAAPPESGGICLFEGQMKDFDKTVDDAPMAAIISALPRPNQAFWTLCALWAGWLWGREAIGPFRTVLKRRRYDWAWHTAALNSPLRRLGNLLPPDTPFLGFVTENEAGFDAAVMIATAMAGFELDTVSLQKHTGQTQLHWHTRSDKSNQMPENASPLKWIVSAVQDTLTQRGEPSPYLNLQAVGLKALSDHHLLSPDENIPVKKSVQAANMYTETRQMMRDALAQPGKFARYQGGKSSIEIGSWWLQRAPETEPPLADRVEMAIVNLLQEKRSIRQSEVEKTLYQEFTGLLTPDTPLIEAVLQSYAELQPDGNWQLREQDISQNRREDIANIRQILLEAGAQLGFPTHPGSTKEGRPLVWENAQNGTPLYFYLIASAILDKIVRQPSHPPEQGLVILPGSRSGLLMFKRTHNPHLAYLLDGGWRTVKFRTVRSLIDSERLSAESLASFFALDPLANNDAQLPLF